MNDLKAKQKHITFLFSNSNKTWLEIAMQSQNKKAVKRSRSNSDLGETKKMVFVFLFFF